MISDDDGAPVQRVYVPPGLIDTIIQYFHEGPGSAHEAAAKVASKISRQYYWPHMNRDIAIFIAACETCAKFRRIARTPRAPLCPILLGSRGEIVALDVMGGKESLLLTPRGNRYILIIIDMFTEFVVAVPIPDQTS